MPGGASEGNPHGEAPESLLFRAWGVFVLRWRWPLLALTLALTALGAYAAKTRLQVDNRIEAFLATRSDAFAVLQELRATFGEDNVLLVIAEGDVFSLPYLELLRKLHHELAGLDLDLPSLGEELGDPAKADAVQKAREARGEEPAGDAVSADEFASFGEDEGWGDEGGGTIVDEIVSLINVRRTRWKDGGLNVEGLLERWPGEADLPAMRAEVLSDRTLVSQVVGPLGRHSVIVLRTHALSEPDRATVYRAVRKIASGYERPGFTLGVAGMPALAAAINEVMLADLARMFGIAVGIMFALLTFLFRHPIGVLGPVLVVVQAAIWTFGTMAAVGSPMTVVTNILPGFLICVGIGDSVHLQSVYRDERQRGVTNHDAIVRAVATTGLPVLFTSLTTAVGLLSFRFATLDAIQNMGTFGAFGVTIALLHSLVFLPIMLSFNRRSLLGLPPGRAARGDFLERFLSFCGGLSTSSAVRVARRRRRAVLVSGFVLATAAVLGASTLAVRHDPLSWFPSANPARAAFSMLDENVGGTANVALLIEANPGRDLRDRDLLLRLEKLEEHIRQYRDPKDGRAIVHNITSALDVVRETHRAVHESKPAFYRVPDEHQGVVDMFTLFENSAPDRLRRLATVDLQKAVMTIRVNWLDAWSYRPLTRHIQAGIDRLVGDSARVRPTGVVFNLFTVVSSLLADLLRSFGVAFAVITLIMIALLRDLKLGLIAMVPNLLPIVFIMGVMGWSKIPIDVNNLLIASIAIGIAVDDTIHFLHQFRAHYLKHGLVEAAIAHAFSHAGRAMMTTSLVLVAGFTVFVAATMANLQRFGLLVGLSVVFALLIDLIFAPALLRTFYRDRAAPGEGQEQGVFNETTTAAA